MSSLTVIGKHCYTVFFYFLVFLPKSLISVTCFHFVFIKNEKPCIALAHSCCYCNSKLSLAFFLHKKNSNERFRLKNEKCVLCDI